MTLTADIKQKAFDLGFDLVGITNASPLSPSQIDHYTTWLKAGYAAEMHYMHRNLEKRTNPAKLLENAQSVICVALNYTPPKTQFYPLAGTGRVANYAQYQDYHPFIKKQLRKLADFMTSMTKENFKFKICVDSAPIAERSFAARAGLGFIGKNHMLINPTLGPQILLGQIITTLKLQSDQPLTETCANCDKCLAACPTGALRPDGRFDANKCISYLTIEHKDKIPADLAKKIDDRLFGCDQCVLACPYQQKAPVCKNKDFKFHPDRANLNLKEILNLTDQQFNTRFADSPLLRLGLEQLKRNTQTCLNNH